MLTGMGADGARAMKAMRDAGSYNLPGRGQLRGVRHAARSHRPRRRHEVLPLQRIAPRLLERLRSTAGIAITGSEA
jgi:two-component system chemotaxis response regulator CheB